MYKPWFVFYTNWIKQRPVSLETESSCLSQVFTTDHDRICILNTCERTVHAAPLNSAEEPTQGDRLHQRGTERQLLLTQFVFELFWIIFNGLEMKKSQSCTPTTKQRCVTDRLFFLEARPCCGVTHLWCLGYGGFGDSYNSKRRKGPTRLFIQRYKGNWRALWSWFQKQRMHLPDPSSSSVYTGTGGVVKSHA